MKILVTGGCGYVGTPLVNRLLDRGYEVIVADTMWFGNHLPRHDRLELVKIDIRDTEKIPLTGVDVIIHLAGIVNDPSVELRPVLSWEVNVLATMRLADMAVRCGVKQFIYASSGSIYGIKDLPEVTEDVPPTPLSAYNKTKMVSERVLLSYKNQMIIQCLRPGTVCGFSPRMRLDVLVNMLVIQAMTKGEVTVLGGMQERPQLHIDDMVAAYLYCIDKGENLQGIYNVSCGNVSVLDAAKAVISVVPAAITVKPTNDPRSYRMNSEKLKRTGFVFVKDLNDAVREIAVAYERGLFSDEDICYSLRWMKKNHPEEQSSL